MHDDVRAVVARPQQVRGGERVVDDEGDAVLVRNVRDAGDVEDLGAGVRDRLPEEHPRGGPDAPPPFREVGRVVDELDLDAEPAQAVLEQPAGARVDALSRQDVVAGLHEPEHGDRQRGLAAADRDRFAAVLQGGDAALEGGGRRVAGAAVGVSGLVAAEAAFRLREAVELETRGEVDGRDPGAVGGIAGLSRVHLGCAELRHPPMVRHHPRCGAFCCTKLRGAGITGWGTLVARYANGAFA